MFSRIVAAEGILQLRDGACVEPWRCVLSPNVGVHCLLRVSRVGHWRCLLSIRRELVLHAGQGLSSRQSTTQAGHGHAVLGVRDLQGLPKLF